jgi:hypothetical protein
MATEFAWPARSLLLLRCKELILLFKDIAMELHGYVSATTLMQGANLVFTDMATEFAWLGLSYCFQATD